jgi:hypothetical protein
MVLFASIDILAHPQHSRSALLRCAVLAYWFDNGLSRMLVRDPVHGMQGFWEKHKIKAFDLPMSTLEVHDPCSYSGPQFRDP